MATPKKKSAAKKKAAKPPAKPRSVALPGMADNAIKPIEQAAERYEEDRDERMACTEREVASKGKLIAVMKKHGKRIYRRKLPDGEVLEIVLEHDEKDTVKVKRKAAREE